MKLVPLLLLHFLILSTQPVTAFPKLHLRDGEEIPWGQWAQGAWDLTAGIAAAGVGAFGSAWNAGASLFQPPQNSDTATTQQNQDVSNTQTDSSTTQQDTNSLGQQNDFQLPPDPTLDLVPTPSAEINLMVIGKTDPNDPCYPSNVRVYNLYPHPIDFDESVENNKLESVTFFAVIDADPLRHSSIIRNVTADPWIGSFSPRSVKI